MNDPGDRPISKFIGRIKVRALKLYCPVIPGWEDIVRKPRKPSMVLEPTRINKNPFNEGRNRDEGRETPIEQRGTPPALILRIENPFIGKCVASLRPEDKP